MIELAPWLSAMVVLILLSAFFSASEAALFYLRAPERRSLEAGNASQQIAARLLSDPDRLLSAVLFWNLLINMTYFALASIAGLKLQTQEHRSASSAAIFAASSLLIIIFCSEMLPKSFAVLRPRWLASVVAIPLAVAVKLVDPLMPVLRTVNLLSRRLIWPGFVTEPYLEATDLEKAVDLSTQDQQLAAQERTALRNIIQLSDIRADEWMRPRTQFLSFQPPVSLSDLQGKLTPSGYLLFTETDGEEIVGALHLKNLFDVPLEHLEHYGAPVIHVPWCAPVSDVLQKMRSKDREVAVVVNEFGETIGILTFEDILDTVFTTEPSRSGRLLDRKAIHAVREDVWHVAGITSLRRIGRQLELELPPSKSVTLAGVIQESLQRLANEGDEGTWGPFAFRVLEAPQRGQMLVELTLVDPSRESDE